MIVAYDTASSSSLLDFYLADNLFADTSLLLSWIAVFVQEKGFECHASAFGI